METCPWCGETAETNWLIVHKEGCPAIDTDDDETDDEIEVEEEH